MKNSIRNLEIEKDPSGEVTRIHFYFGPHYYIDVQPDEKGILSIYAGATHHGFKAHAAEISGEWERFIEEIRKNHPDATTD